jgi:hypothetical protein
MIAGFEWHPTHSAVPAGGTVGEGLGEDCARAGEAPVTSSERTATTATAEALRASAVCRRKLRLFWIRALR